jgi:hypothetical protein
MRHEANVGVAVRGSLQSRGADCTVVFCARLHAVFGIRLQAPVSGRIRDAAGYEPGGI